jgi:hypothetical protein
MEVAATKMDKPMTTKTLILAAAAVMTLGIGSAFADADGSGINTYRAAAPMSSGSHQAMYGRAAGDSMPRASGWVDRNGTGGGG